METKSNPPSTIQTADKSPTVIPLFVGDVTCDVCGVRLGDSRARGKAALGDWIGNRAAYAVYSAVGRRVADHMGDELMGDQDAEVVVVLDKDGDGLAV